MIMTDQKHQQLQALLERPFIKRNGHILHLMTADEKMGLQFGETLVVKKNGCESLNAYPRQWVTCES